MIDPYINNKTRKWDRDDASNGFVHVHVIIFASYVLEMQQYINLLYFAWVEQRVQLYLFAWSW